MTRPNKICQSRLVVASLLATLVACALAAGTASAAVVADYRFDDNLNSSVGLVPALTEVGAGTPTYATETVNGTIDRVRVFPAGSGLSLPTTGLVSPERYTFEITFRLTEASTWERVFDASNATTDNGVYVKNNKLDYYDNHTGGDHFGSSGFAADTFYTVAISRSASGLVTIYQDGTPQISYNDASNTGVLKSPDLPARFFIDDNVISGENSPGAVARIRVYDTDIPVASTDEGKNGTVTKVHCNYVVATELSTCFAQVADARPGTTKRPAGAVKFSSANGGSFVAGNTCNLVPTNASPNVSSCSVQYASPSNTFPKVAAAYQGSAEHSPSTGTTTFYILGGRSSGFGIDLGTAPTLGAKTSGPMTVGCSAAKAKTSAAVIAFTSTQCMIAITAAIEEKKNAFTGKSCLEAKTFTELKNCNPRYEEALEEWERLQAEQTAKLEDLVDKRADLWKELKDIIDDYNKSARDVINRAGKKSSAIAPIATVTKKKRGKAIVIGKSRMVVKAGKQKTVRLKMTPQWKPLLTMIRRLNKALPGLDLGVNATLTVETTRAAKGAKPKRKRIKRVVAYRISP